MKNLIKAVNLEKINGYTYFRSLSGGQMSHSVIYENHKKEKVVVKFLIYPRNDFELKRFYQEAESLKRINSIKGSWSIKLIFECQKHPNYDIHYFAMEYVEGTTLKHYFEENLPLSVEKSTSLLLNLGIVLSDAVSQGLVHRDLHPGNIIMLNKSEESEPNVRIIDFGVSHCIMKYLFSGEVVNDEFRHIGAISSWSPELLNNPNSVRQSHDVWGLGCIYYRMLTGEYPFEADCFGNYYNSIINGTYNNDNLKYIEERFVHHLVQRMLDVNPDTRISLINIGYICQNYLSDKLKYLSHVPNLEEFYFKHDGDIWICTNCTRIVHPNGNRCTNCGQFVNEFMPFYSIVGCTLCEGN